MVNKPRPVIASDSEAIQTASANCNPLLNWIAASPACAKALAWLLAMTVCVLLTPSIAHADCSGLAATFKGLAYDTATSTSKYCDGTNWVAAGGGGGSIPSGAVMAFNLSACPTGWSAANGTGGRPDLRGEFIRGLDSGRGVDTGRTLNSWQAQAIQAHTHNFRFWLADGQYDWTNPLRATSSNQSQSATYTTDSAGGPETRPRNVALLYCVKD